MTSKLKCPVCNHKLYQTASEPATYCCLYKDCQSDFKFAGSKELWQALIQAKQDLDFFKEEQDRSATALIERTKELDKCQKYLEIARKALEWLGNNRLAENPVRVEQLRRYARNTLEKINHDNSEKANSIEHKE